MCKRMVILADWRKSKVAGGRKSFTWAFSFWETKVEDSAMAG